MPYISDEDYKKIEYVENNNKCPKCGSKRISICKGIEIEVEENLSTGKVLKKDKIGATTFWIYKCRKCGWLSETCCE